MGKPERLTGKHPTCTTCNDTHRMPERYGRGAVWACTACPVPCEACRGRLSAFCKTTPCACACHRRTSDTKGDVL